MIKYHVSKTGSPSKHPDLNICVDLKSVHLTQLDWQPIQQHLEIKEYHKKSRYLLFYAKQLLKKEDSNIRSILLYYKFHKYILLLNEIEVSELESSSYTKIYREVRID